MLCSVFEKGVLDDRDAGERDAMYPWHDQAGHPESQEEADMLTLTTSHRAHLIAE